jgi:hypothetical protein
MKSPQIALEANPRRSPFGFPDAEESPKISVSKVTIAKDSPLPWVVTKTTETILIQTYDTKWVKSLVTDFRIVSQDQDLLFEQEFSERADRWEKDTGFYSSPTKRFLHEDYQIIMTMGDAVIPLILKRLQNRPDDWFWALKHLARKDMAAGIDNFDEAVQAWLRWGIEKGYISFP